MKLEWVRLWRSLGRAAGVLGVAATVVAGCGGAKASAPTVTKVSCATAQVCRTAIAKVVGQSIVLPSMPELDFVSGQAASPGSNYGGWYGALQYHDTNTGWTVNYVVWSATPTGYGSPSKCYRDLPFTSHSGWRGCYQDQAVRWNQLYAKFTNNGLVYVMNAKDPRPPAPAVAAADQSWAIELVNSCA